MLSFPVINLILPNDSTRLELNTPLGPWIVEKSADSDHFKAEITTKSGLVAETYFLENQVSHQGDAPRAEAAFEELTPILLSLSYALGHAVSIRRSTPISDVMIVQPSQHWPRPRGIHDPAPIVASDCDLATLVERAATSWPTASATYKTTLLIHHWLDALSCWSLEDLYLSATTLLQIVAATEERDQGVTNLGFMKAVNEAASRFGLPALSADFKNMRNDLIHDGHLSGSRFANKSREECAEVAADVLNWIDQYVIAVLRLGPISQVRFKRTDLYGLNSFSMD